MLLIPVRVKLHKGADAAAHCIELCNPSHAARVSHVLTVDGKKDTQYSTVTGTGRYASAARAFISPTAFEQARGGALGAGGGRVGFAGGGLFGVGRGERSASGLRLLSPPRLRLSR
jgi:hypothetical protein